MDIKYPRYRIALLLFFLLTGALAGHDVIGLALYPDSSEHDGIRVTIQGAVTETVYTTSIGSYTFTGLSSNFYSFSYYAPGYTEAWLRNIAVLSDQALPQMTLSPVPDTFLVQGIVRCGSDTVHDSVLVTLETPSGSLLDSARSADDGTFSLVCPDSGSLALTFRKLGYRTLRDTVRIISDTILPDTFRLTSTPVISGMARLRDRPDHRGIAVTLVSGIAVHDSVTTGMDGSFALSVPDTGYYNVSFFKENWHSRTIRSLHLLADTLLDTVFLDTFSIDTVYAGTLKTDQHWSADHIRVLIGDVTVDTGVTLTIEAGTRLRPAASDSLKSGLDKNLVELTVRGTLVAEGDSTRTVSIHRALNAGAYTWRGIRVTGTRAAADLRHCLIADAHTGVRADSGAAVTVTDGNIRLNLIGALVTGGSARVRDTRIEQNAGSGMLCTRSVTDISGCKLYNNSGNPLNISGGRATVFNTLIYKNTGTAGITVSDSADMFLYNCTLAQNGLYGLTNARSRTVLFNSIFTKHTQNAVSNDATAISSGIEIAYNAFYDNGAQTFRNCPAELEVPAAVTAAGDSCDIRYNLYSDPGFTYWPSYVTLADTSSCIETGTALYISTQTADTIRIVMDSSGVRPNRGHDAAISRITGVRRRPETIVTGAWRGRDIYISLDGKRTDLPGQCAPGIYLRITTDGRVEKILNVRR